MNELPFTGIECRDCGYLADTQEQWSSHSCVTTDHDAKVSRFIKRWCMPWHQEDARKELDELIDEAVRNQIP